MDKDVVVSNLKSTMLKLSSEAAYNYLAAAFPFLRLPIISTIAKVVINKVTDTVLDNAELGIYILYIDKVTKDQAGDFVEAVKKHEEAKANGTKEDQAKAEQAQIDAFRKLAKYGH